MGLDRSLRASPRCSAGPLSYKCDARVPMLDCTYVGGCGVCSLGLDPLGRLVRVTTVALCGSGLDPILALAVCLAPPYCPKSWSFARSLDASW